MTEEEYQQYMNGEVASPVSLFDQQAFMCDGLRQMSKHLHLLRELEQRQVRWNNFRNVFFNGKISKFSFMHLSGHDYLDAERADRLMNTHWNTVWSNRHHRALSLFSSTAWVWLRVSMPWQFQFHCKFHVSRSGVRIPAKIFFSLFFLPPTFCNGESMENIFPNNFIDWLIWVVVGVPSKKVALTGIWTPDLERCNLKWNTQWFTQCSNGCSLGSLLFPRQDNHVQRCTREFGN